MNNKFVIGVIGTQNTGKSTFISDLISKYKISEYKELTQVGCDYRKKIEEAGLSINRKGNLESQKIICNTLIEQLDIIKSMPDGNYITDRSPLDSYVYTIYLYVHNPELGITENDLRLMYKNVKKSMSYYDTIIFLDLDQCQNITVVDDKFRDTDLEYRKEIDQIFKSAILALINDDSTMYNKIEVTFRGDRQDRIDCFHELYKNKLIKN